MRYSLEKPNRETFLYIPPGTLLDDHEHGDRHMRKLNNLGEIDPKA